METSLLQEIAAWGGGIVAGVTALAVLARRLSHDRIVLAKDRVESSFVALLLKERDAAIRDAHDAWEERHADTQAIARLSVENEYQAKEIARLTTEFAAFKRVLIRLYPQTREFLESEFGTTGPMPLDFDDIPTR
jgi:hypothetical protein